MCSHLDNHHTNLGSIEGSPTFFTCVIERIKAKRHDWDVLICLIKIIIKWTYKCLFSWGQDTNKKVDLFTLFSFLLIILLIRDVGPRTMMCEWRTKDNFGESLLSFHLVETGLSCCCCCCSAYSRVADPQVSGGDSPVSSSDLATELALLWFCVAVTKHWPQPTWRHFLSWEPLMAWAHVKLVKQ